MDIAIPPKAPPKAEAMGGGGGQRGPTPVTKGTPPKFADQQIVPPKAPPMEEPKIKIQPTIEVQFGCKDGVQPAADRRGELADCWHVDG